MSRPCTPLVSSQMMSPNPDDLLWPLQSLPLCDFWAAPSLISNCSNLPYGTQGRSQKLESCLQETGDRKASILGNPTEPCLVSVIVILFRSCSKAVTSKSEMFDKSIPSALEVSQNIFLLWEPCMKWEQIAEQMWKPNREKNLGQSSFPLFKSVWGRCWQG